MLTFLCCMFESLSIFTPHPVDHTFNSILGFLAGVLIFINTRSHNVILVTALICSIICIMTEPSHFKLHLSKFCIILYEQRSLILYVALTANMLCHINTCTSNIFGADYVLFQIWSIKSLLRRHCICGHFVTHKNSQITILNSS